MKRKLFAGILAGLLVLLCACGGTGNAPPSVGGQAEGVPSTPAEAPAEPLVPDNTWTQADAAGAAQRLADDPGAFGAVFAEYKTQNSANLTAPEDWDTSTVGWLLDVEGLEENAEATGGGKVLILYEQQTNAEAKLLDKKAGIFLDAMLLLSDEQVPESLAQFDYLVTIRAFPNTAFEYSGGLPAIQWGVGVYLTDMASGQTSEPVWFEGSAPPTAFTTTENPDYNDGSFPLGEAVAYVADQARQGFEYEPMSVTSSGIVDGVILDEYGMRGTEKHGEMPSLSLPLSIHNAPYGTVCYAVLMTDPDAAAIAGHEWLHWMVVNLERTELEAGASWSAASFVQGVNDFGAPGYGGPTPPDKPHTYVITVYALKHRVNLGEGFTREEFEQAIEDNVLAEAQITGRYDN